jgi:hypothetical protein
MKRILFFTGILCVTFGIVACGEREQVAESKRGYQGKHDSNPWDNEPLVYGSGKWSKGDRTSWETQIKTRQLGQHEDKRIYQ